MSYRFYQFMQALFPRILPLELKWVEELLPACAFELFNKQRSAEQRHAINVAKSIQNKLQFYQGISEQEFQNLLISALLHDCGKSLIPIRLWHKISIVLLQKLPSKILSAFEQQNNLFTTPLQIASHHAEWGEKLASQSGLDPEICKLIRLHHTPETLLGRILQEADNEN